MTRQSACNQQVSYRFSRSSAVCFQEILQFKPQTRRHVPSCLSNCFTRARCRLGCQTAVSLDSICWVCICFSEGILFRCWICATLSLFLSDALLQLVPIAERIPPLVNRDIKVPVPTCADRPNTQKCDDCNDMCFHLDLNRVETTGHDKGRIIVSQRGLNNFSAE